MSVSYALEGDAATFTYVGTAAATVVLTITKPDGTTDTPAVTESPAGTYTAVAAVDQTGTWAFKFESTGTATDAEDGSFHVDLDLDHTIYAHLDEVKDRAGISKTTSDDLIRKAIRVASRAVDEFCLGRRFYADTTATARVYRAQDCELLLVDDISTLTGLIVKVDNGATGSYDETLTITTDFVTAPHNAIARGKPVEQLIRVTGTWPMLTMRPRVQVTAKWGWPRVPEQVREAALLTTARLFKRKDAPFGVAGFTDVGAVMRILKSDPDVVGLLENFQASAVA